MEVRPGIFRKSGVGVKPSRAGWRKALTGNNCQSQVIKSTLVDPLGYGSVVLPTFVQHILAESDHRWNRQV